MLYKNKFSKSVVIEVTKMCNLRCKHCFTNGGEKLKDEFSKDELIEKINELINIGFKDITLSGGEPTCRADMLEILKNINKKDTIVGLFTNGFNINKSNIMQYAKYIDIFVVSIDGDEESHDILRGEESYHDVIKFINLLREYKLKFAVQTMIINENKGKIDEMISKYKKLGATAIKFSHVGEQGRAEKFKTLLLDNVDKEKMLVDILKNRDNNIYIEHNFILKDKFIKKRDEFRKVNLHILSNGFMLPYYGFEKFIIGNIKGVNIKKLLNDYLASERYLKFIAFLDDAYEMCLKFENNIVPYEEVLIENERKYNNSNS